MSFRKLGPINV